MIVNTIIWTRAKLLKHNYNILHEYNDVEFDGVARF